ncbi:MAG: hypothetical protein CMH52_04165 [Myxococcales bacterium]|mgnify:CR=1 FL=1|nr:hypothetical protein [Myxococcales bacterium]|tara:strand:- start:1953 stop:2174 length:222 start_codon:yes stop_codon:yes gene_type:complete
MKMSQVLISIGAAAILGMLAFYLYLAQTPPYERTHQRGLDLNTARVLTSPDSKAKAAGDTPPAETQGQDSTKE